MSLRRSLLAGVFAAVAATATLSLAQTPSIPFGTILGVTAGDGLTGGGTIGNVTLTQYTGVNPQLGTTYTVLSTDRAKLVTFSNLSSVVVTLPTATGTFGAGFAFWASCYGPGSCILTPTSGSVNGTASLTLLAGEAAYVVSDGGNWLTALGGAGGGISFAITGDVHGTGTGVITTTVLAVNGVNYPSSVLAPIGTMPFVTSTGQITYASPGALLTPGTLGLGTMALQNANAVAITGGTGVFSALTATNLTATNLGATRINGGQLTFSSTTGLSVPANATVSGVNTGDQTITLSGAVTGSGTGAITTTLASSIVFTSNLAPIISSRVIGNATGATATPRETTASQVLDFIGTDLGSILLRNATSWVTLTPAASGVLTTNGTSALPSWAAAGGTGFSQIIAREFTTSGVYTPTSGMLYAVVFATGGGGGGGGANSGATPSGGGGGGAGRTIITVFSATTIGASQVVTIGAGASGAAADGNASGGGNTTLGVIVTATGGNGGSAGGAANGGDGGNVLTTASIGNLNIAGGGGIAGQSSGGALTASVGGTGGSSFWGGGGRGLAGAGTALNATVYGSGGGGGGSTATAGKAGASGYIAVLEFK